MTAYMPPAGVQHVDGQRRSNPHQTQVDIRVLVMRADHRMPENRRPPYRATRVWVKRDGRWQMAASQQTTRI